MFVKSKLNILLVLLPVILNSLAESTVPRASFGEVCGPNGPRCDTRSFLTCTEDKCQCVKPKEMTFDKNQGSCLVLSGERCTYTAIKDSQETRWTERLDCVENAKCGTEGTCSCIQGYYEDTKGFCAPNLMHGETCSEIQKCREDLTCVDGFCKCNNSDTVFDPDHNQCVIKAGNPCSNTKPCVKNAFCSDTGTGYLRSYSWRSTVVPQGNCTCSDYYKVSKDGLCLAKYNHKCNSQTTPCLEDLSCINGQCGCPYPEHQVYQYGGINKCVSFVRGPCKENVTGNIVDYPCVSKAECVNDSVTGIHECRCSKGYIESGQRTCALEYGQNCEASRSNNPCDAVANLICKNGKCACPGLQDYNNSTSTCQGLVGAECKLGVQFCIEGAYCHSYRDMKIGEGVCECETGWVANSERKCVKN